MLIVGSIVTPVGSVRGRAGAFAIVITPRLRLEPIVPDHAGAMFEALGFAPAGRDEDGLRYRRTLP